MAVYDPRAEALAGTNASPELLFSAERYARTVFEPVQIDPDSHLPKIDKFSDSLSDFAGQCMRYADSSEGLEGELALRWVEVAKRALIDCGRVFPELKGVEKTRLFGPRAERLQRQLYAEIRFNIIIPS